MDCNRDLNFLVLNIRKISETVESPNSKISVLWTFQEVECQISSLFIYCLSEDLLSNSMLIVIENLLTTSADRKLYEQLWNLASNKGSKNSKFPNENFSIAEICTQLMREIQQKDPDRNRFYFSTQLAFGTVLLYRRQVEKFYREFHITSKRSADLQILFLPPQIK